jgi:hypothetical protein
MRNATSAARPVDTPSPYELDLASCGMQFYVHKGRRVDGIVLQRDRLPARGYRCQQRRLSVGICDGVEEDKVGWSGNTLEIAFSTEEGARMLGCKGNQCDELPVRSSTRPLG